MSDLCKLRFLSLHRIVHMCAQRKDYVGVLVSAVHAVV
jgi:hypothetical protein